MSAVDLEKHKKEFLLRHEQAIKTSNEDEARHYKKMLGIVLDVQEKKAR